jgi:hypothetical protein
VTADGARESYTFFNVASLTSAGEAADNRNVMFPSRLSRIDQLKLNARALWLDVRQGNLAKLRFHLRGLWRALGPARV